jgi:DNA-directed RNA polymerase subunit RPC12/RpoP
MTIRIRCAECQRKLKVPDEALGKTVQCPACGGRFIGRLDAEPPPAPPLESPPPLQHPPLEMMAASPFEEREPASAPPEPPPSPLPNLELEETVMDAQPAAVEAVEPHVVEEAVAEEPIVVEEAATDESEAVDPIVLDDEPADAVEVVEEADEDEPKKGGKSQTKKKKSRGLLCGCLAGVGLVLLLGCGGAGFFGYRMYNGAISDSDWKTFAVPEGRCTVLMPGDPVSAVEPLQPNVMKFKYTVEKPWARSEFHLLYWELPGTMAPALIDARIDEEAAQLCRELGGTVGPKRSFVFGKSQGREARLDLTGGRTGFVRFYLTPGQGQSRIHELYAVGPNMQTTDGAGGKFFNSFSIFEAPPGQPGPNRPPGLPPGR